jgi:hypothetical protein
MMMPTKTKHSLFSISYINKQAFSPEALALHCLILLLDLELHRLINNLIADFFT